MTRKTFFGLEIVNGRGVRLADIKRLPFANFWSEGITYLSQIKDNATNEWLLPATKWTEFSRHFIATGRHNFADNLSKKPWGACDETDSDETYFGLQVSSKQMVREIDIATLPFFGFWRDSSIGSTGLINPKTNEHFIHLQDWKAFSEMFIKTGRHRYMPDTDRKKVT
jgi:hypothetical protein